MFSGIEDLKKRLHEYFLGEFQYDTYSDWSTEISDFEEFEIPYLRHLISTVSGVSEDQILISCTKEPLGYHGSASDIYLKIYQLDYYGNSPEIQKIKHKLFPLILQDD